MLQKLKRVFDRFEQTIIEANYRSEPRTFWSLLFRPKKSNLPETPQITVGSKMIGTSKMLGNKFVWGSIFAILSIKSLVATAAVLASTGLALFGFEYLRCRRDRKDVITETNFAGQKVEGTRADLCRLHQAQVRIMNVESAFKQASLESTTDTIRGIIEGVSEERRRVKVLDGGRYGAQGGAYTFSRPQISLVDESHVVDFKPQPAREPKPGLREQWEKSCAHCEGEIVERIRALHESLPPHIKDKVELKMKPAA